jgi:hypothetical protein
MNGLVVMDDGRMLKEGDTVNEIHWISKDE